MLSDDLGRREIAVEALLAGGAESAVEHATRLARHAKRAAVRFRNEDRLDRVRAVDFQEPFARAVLRGGIADHRRRLDERGLRELLSQPLRQIAHAREVALARLMAPI